jgi:hypothetical protein
MGVEFFRWRDIRGWARRIGPRVYGGVERDKIRRREKRKSSANKIKKEKGTARLDLGGLANRAKPFGVAEAAVGSENGRWHDLQRAIIYIHQTVCKRVCCAH